MKSSCLIEKNTAMDSASVVNWADLLPELLEKISDSLETPTDIVGFRSVCQSWRSSTRALPQKLSPYFPYIVRILAKPGWWPEGNEHDHTIYASAIYLVRSRSDPNKAWLAAVQEVSPGKLILRNALTYHEIHDAASGFDSYDLVDQTIVARFYTINQICKCGGVSNAERAIFVWNSSPIWPSYLVDFFGECSSQLVGLCVKHDRLVVFKLVIGLNKDDDCEHVRDLGYGYSHFVNFEGRILAIDRRGRIYVLDFTELEDSVLVEMTCIEEDSVVEMSSITHTMRCGHEPFVFVVSDGNLYVVWLSPEKDECRIYRVSLVDTGYSLTYKVKQIGDLGDTVLFIGCRNWSFSISGQYLPQPWKQGNCVVFCGALTDTCQCDDIPRYVEDEHLVFNLGTQQFTKISTLDDLFSPPRSPSSC